MRGAQRPHIAQDASGVRPCCVRTTNSPAQRRAVLRPRPSPSRGAARSRGASSHPACSAVAQQESAQPDQQQQQPLLSLEAREATAENFAPFGQVIGASDDGMEYGEGDAQLQLENGTPRFYIMRIQRRGLQFDRITYHARVTQCLGSLTVEPWYLVVAEPTGSLERPPGVEDLHAFRIPHGKFVRLHAGTWHAGPLFDAADDMMFYNLELADTNVVDHNTHVYDTQRFVVSERRPTKWWSDTLPQPLEQQ